MNLAEKRAHVLASMVAPEFKADSAVIKVEDAIVAEEGHQAEPFFGGYMEDMLEDMGVSPVEESAEEGIALKKS